MAEHYLITLDILYSNLNFPGLDWVLLSSCASLFVKGAFNTGWFFFLNRAMAWARLKIIELNAVIIPFWSLYE